MLRIYLNEDAPVEAGKCAGFIIKYDDGLPYVERVGQTLRTPESLKPHIREVTAVHSFPSNPPRTAGEYRKGEVRAFVDRKTPSELKIFIVGKTLEEVFSLYCDIRAGRVTPTVSWEEKQVPELPAKEASTTI